MGFEYDHFWIGCYIKGCKFVIGAILAVCYIFQGQSAGKEGFSEALCYETSTY
jgi:hypothetical protein